jgi:hypothetical protein
MGQQVAGNAAAGDLRVQAPQPGAALRQVFGDGPVLQEFGPIVEDSAKAALVDELACKGDGRHATVIVPDHVGHARLFDGFNHPPAFLAGARQGLLA